MIYEIKNEKISLQISSLGAEMVSLKKDGKERLWQNENGGWSGHAPILFPKCGDCSMYVDGKSYAMKSHGLARSNEFALVEKTENSIKLAFSSSEETKTVYPYDFVFTASYRLDGEKLFVGYEIYNPSDLPMYAFCGSHESYALDGEVDEYEVVFEKEEVFDSYLHNPDWHALTGETVGFGKGKRFPLPKEFMEDNTVIFGNVNSREVELRKIGGERVAKLYFDGFDNLLLWHPRGSRMVCVEPWQNLPDMKGEERKELSLRNGVQKIEPKTSKYFEHVIEY